MGTLAILVSTIGSGGSSEPEPVTDGAILLETGDGLLLETGDAMLLE